MNTEKLWDKLSGKYDNRVKKYEESYKKAIAKIKLYLKNEDVILDYACGTGLISNEISRNVSKIHAIDISSKMLELAKSKADESKLKNIDFEQTTIFNDTFKKESFDVIIAFNVLHILENPKKQFKRINELLKPDAYFISTTPCLGEKRSLMNVLIYLLNKIGMVRFMNKFKIPELKDQILKSGFQIIESELFVHDQKNYFIVAKKIKKSN